MTGLPKQCPSCGGFGCGSPCQYGFNKSDPIAYELWGHGFSTEEKCERFAKQIRQQIGRELEQLTLDDGSINEEAWRKVCKM